MLGARVGDLPHTGAPSLSVCCLTRGPTNRVAAQLRLLRDVADEIVVGLDTSVDAELAHPLEDVADVLVHYPYVDPVDRPVGWIHSLCTRDWILWVDDDEIPSARLVATVRETIADPSVTHCFVPRRTLWGDAGRILAGRRGCRTSSSGSSRTTRASSGSRASRTGRSRRSGRTATSTRRCTTPTSS